MQPTPQAFDEFCRGLSPRLVGALVVQFRDRARAEDVAQEAFARAWARWSSVSAMARPESWVFTVAFRVAIGGHRRRAAERRALERAGRLEVDDVEGPTEALVVDRLVVEAALVDMSPRQRAVVSLRYYAGFGVADTAAILGCAEGTVKALTSQAIRRLRSGLDEGDETTAETGDETGDDEAPASAAPGGEPR
jgi:RNA polymerase sigma-70 factor (ECF subfamily)